MNLKIAVAFSILFFLPLLSSADTAWIDVRSVAEYKASRIEGDINIPHFQIGKKISQFVDNKDTEIKLYCVSGVRANFALKVLKQQGYTNVSNVATVENARQLRSQ